MWCLLSSSSWQVGSLTFRQHTVLPCRDWRLQYSSNALEATLGAEFDLSSLKTSLIRVGHSGTNHHWPRLSRKGRNFHRNSAVPAGSRWHPVESGCGVCVCVGGIGNAALWQIVRYMRLVIAAVSPSQFYFAGLGDNSLDSRTDSWTSLPLHWRRAVKYPLPCEVSLHPTCFLFASCGIFFLFFFSADRGAVSMYDINREAAVSTCLLWERTPRRIPT